MHIRLFTKEYYVPEKLFIDQHLDKLQSFFIINIGKLKKTGSHRSFFLFLENKANSYKAFVRQRIRVWIYLAD